MSICEENMRRHFIEHNLKVTLILKNVTVEEIEAIQKFLKEYRDQKKQVTARGKDSPR